MEVYATKTEGLGGVIKDSVDDFVVEEVLVDDSKANVSGGFPSRVLGSTVHRQRYLLCLLVKRNWDTFIAIKNVAKSLGIDPGRVQFAGIKDAKAATAQYVTLDNVSMEEAVKVDVKGVQVYPIGYMREMLSLFYLLGNNFTITIKHAELPEPNMKEGIQQTIQEIDTIGLPNFFGHQRFGTTRPITHLVGRALAQGCFEEAAMLFWLNPAPMNTQSQGKLGKNYKRHKITNEQTRTSPPTSIRKANAERSMENPTDFIGAFRRLPPKLQALFVQAHQSYLFNRFLSGRLKRGLPLNEAVLGDFVVGVERSGLPLTTAEKIVTAENLAGINEAVKVGKMRVALPIFGVRQKLSGGIMGEIEREVLSEEGVEAEKLRLNELSRAGGKGGLRTAATPLREFKLQSILGDAGGEGSQATLSFMLLRGCYATVLLREMMKPADPVTAGF